MLNRNLIRSGLARAAYDRILFDNEQRNADHSHSYWYEIDTRRLPTQVSSKFITYYKDTETQQFIDSCIEKSDWVFMQMLHLLVKGILSFFLTQTSINGLLGRGSMYIFSSEQFQNFLHIDKSIKENKYLLDIGAGDGAITSIMSKYYEKTFVTEISKPMIHILRQKQFILLDSETWFNDTRKYDLISCLNVFDRCDKPTTLLANLKYALKPDGRLLVALVLPFRQFVESNGENGNQPSEKWLIEGKTFVDQLIFFAEIVFPNAGFIVESVTKLPYLCEGGLDSSFYVLYDAVFLLSKS